MADDKILTEEEEEIVVDPNNPESSVVGGTAGVTVGDVNAVGSNVGVTAQPISGIPLYKGAMADYDAWMSENGYDPDKDYNEAKAALEYDYETSMANYGRRAEELSQMGLSNSGLSDIYQLGAFNSYLQSQNELSNQLIAAKKKYRQEYNALKTEEETAIKTDTANAYNFALEQFDWEMGEDGSFTTNNAEDIRAQLLSQGYDKTVVDNVVNMLTSLDPASLPTEKAQAAERKKAQEEANAKAELKSTATRLAFNAYNMENIGEVESMLLNTPGVDSQMAQEILDELKKLTPEQLAESTAYKKKVNDQKRQDENDINAAVADILEKSEYDGDPTERKKIENLYTALGWSPEKVAAFMEKLDAVITQKTEEQVEEEAEAEKNSNVAKITAELEGIYGKYVWGERTKEKIRQAYAGTEYEKYLDDAFNKHATNAEKVLEAEAKDLVGALDADSPDSDELFAGAYDILGIDQATWDSMDDEDKTLEILIGIEEIDSAKGAEIIGNWYSTSVNEILTEYTSSIEQCGKVDELIDQIEYLRDKGAISRKTAEEVIDGENGLKKFKENIKANKASEQWKSIGDTVVGAVVGALEQAGKSSYETGNYFGSMG